MHYICNVSSSSSTIINSLSYDNVIASDRRNCMCNAFSPMLRPCSRRRKYLYIRVDKWPYPYTLVGVIAYTFPNFIGNYIIHTAHRIQTNLKSCFLFWHRLQFSFHFLHSKCVLRWFETCYWHQISLPKEVTDNKTFMSTWWALLFNELDLKYKF